MCYDQAVNSQPGPARSELSRRDFVHGTAAVGAAVAILRRMPRLPLRSAARDGAADGTSAYSMAMHIHSSIIEQSGSRDCQLVQAAKNSADGLWWTDHDYVMDGIGYRTTVHFTSLTSESGGPGERGPWIWTKAESGPLASTSGGGIVTTPCSPNDPVVGGSLHLTARSTTTATAKFGYYADSHPAGWNYHDNLTGQSLSIASKGDVVGGYFDYLRFTRRISGEASLLQQMDMEPVLAIKYPGVVQRQGLEVSWLLPHINWFGGDVAIPSYGSTTSKTYTTYLQSTVVPQIHTAGGLVSYNHPYGYGDPPLLTVTQQDALLEQVAARLLPTATTPAALGADLLEVGYPRRQGVDLAHHVALWDVMSRNAVFLTGTGTNDDHFGQNWRGIRNNWFTSTWAASTAEANLLASLAAGRVWCASLSSYRGSLDLMVDGSCPMGSVSVSSVTSRKLVARATGVPTGGSLQILQGTVDDAGTAGLQANTKVIGTYTAAELAGGSVTRWIDTTNGRFVRTRVLNSSGAVVGLSNPVWLLRSAPPGGIPRPRSA